MKNTFLLLLFLLNLCHPVSGFALDNPSPSPEGSPPEKDTYVNSAYPNTNFGQEKRLTTGFTSSSKIIFLKFNLDKLPAAVLENDEERVILNIWLEESNGQEKTINTELLLPQDDWDENTLNWNNKPSLEASEITIDLEATPGAKKIDLTPLVKKWLSGEEPNRGVAFYHNLESFNRTFSAKENDKHQPTLAVEKRPAKSAEINAAETEKIEPAFPNPLPKTSLKGTQTEKTITDYLNQKSIIPLASLWTVAIFGLLVRLFKDFPLA